MNTKKNLYGIILAGGGGTRLWPLSREACPKQFLRLTGNQTLLQLTHDRLGKFVPQDNIITITSQSHTSTVQEQLGQSHTTLGEPIGKNTAPAIGLGIKHFQQKNDSGSDPVIIVTPSDHLIKDEKSFLKAAEEGAKLAEDGAIVIFGIKPTRPETGYGYVHATSKAFVEKPDYETALKYIQYGDYYWNSGIFMFKLSTITEEMSKYSPEILTNLDNYKKLPSISIDYAVMEKTDKLTVIPVDCGWNDLGSWDAVNEVLDKDKHKNAFVGKVEALRTENTLVYSTTRPVAIIGVKDIIVIESEAGVVVCHKEESQDVKEIVDNLKQQE